MENCFVHLDDVLVVSKRYEEHLKHLHEVFEQLRKANLKLKPKKCCFLRPEVHFLGHVISREGIRPDSMKTEKVRNYPQPGCDWTSPIFGTGLVLPTFCSWVRHSGCPIAQVD